MGGEIGSEYLVGISAHNHVIVLDYNSITDNGFFTGRDLAV